MKDGGLTEMRTVLVSLLIWLAACSGGNSSSSSSSPGTSPTSSSTASLDGFVLGAWVGADPYAWGDLRGMGNNSLATIDAIAADMEAMGLNTVWVSGFSSFYDGEDVYGRLGLIEEWLDAGERHNLKVVIQGSGDPYVIPQDPDVARLTRNTVIPRWEEIAGRFRSHQALLAYCPVEEIGVNVPDVTPMLEALDEVGDAVAAIDPNHPVITIHIATWFDVAQEELAVRGRTMRAEVADFYPFTDINDWTRETLGSTSFATPDQATDAVVDMTLRHVQLADSASIPMWLFAQSGSSIWYRRLGGLASAPESRPLFRMPTEAEMSFQIWGPIVSGARGVFFFPYTSTTPYSSASLATLMEWEYGTGLRTLEGQPTQAHRGLDAAGRRLRPHLALVGRLRPDGSLIKNGMFLGRLFRDGAGPSYVILVNRDVGTSGRASSAVLPSSLGEAETLTDVFTNRTYTRRTIGDLEFGAGVGTLLRVGS